MGRCRLSLAQQRLWFLTHLDERAELRLITSPLSMRLRGVLDRTALRAALDRIVARHESLRTHFEWIRGEALQRIEPPEVGFALAERRIATGEAGTAQLQRWLAEGASSGFDLTAGPLIRGQLIDVSDEEHVLQLTMHHIVSDGWSIGRAVAGAADGCMGRIAPGKRIRCRRSRSSTPTMRSGSGSG